MGEIADIFSFANLSVEHIQILLLEFQYKISLVFSKNKVQNSQGQLKEKQAQDLLEIIKNHFNKSSAELNNAEDIHCLIE